MTSAVEGRTDVSFRRANFRLSPRTETLPIDYCALRGPDLYAILYEDRRALCLARDDDSIVRLIDALDDDDVLGGCSRMRRPQGSVSSKSAVSFWRIFLTTS